MHAATHRCFDARLSLLAHAGASAYVNAQPIFLYPSVWIDTHAARVAAEVEHAIRTFSPVPNLLARIHALRAFDLRGKLSDITAPSLVVAADDDVLVPCHASQALAQGLPDARLYAMPYGGHACNVTCPESFNHALIDFIVSNSSDVPASLVSQEEA
jgi:aminoacrylate hydrolase